MKWNQEAKNSFQHIKQAVIKAPVLVRPQFYEEFFIFSFASQETIVVVLLQKNSKGCKQPISFFIKVLRDAELKYDILEKQVYALIKASKSFQVYILHSKIIAYVPSSAIIDILVQPDSEGKRGKWIAKLLEYDVDIKPTKFIKGQGLAKLLVDSNCKALGLNYINILTEEINQNDLHPEDINLQVHEKYHISSWYKEIVYLLQHLQTPPDLEK